MNLSFLGKWTANFLYTTKLLQCYSRTTVRAKHFQVVVLGGGTGGASISNALGRKLGKNRVAVVEPSE
uniref:Uncharacterized protein n=1 Tax=Romanomermis culicivorax TaxID=13658 RepID=A0A915LDV5_ROMCU